MSPFGLQGQACGNLSSCRWRRKALDYEIFTSLVGEECMPAMRRRVWHSRRLTGPQLIRANFTNICEEWRVFVATRSSMLLSAAGCSRRGMRPCRNYSDRTLRELGELTGGMQ